MAQELDYSPQARIRAARYRLGLTQEQLARRAGVGVHTLRDVELGRVRRPHAGVVARLLDASDAHPTIRVLGTFGVEWAGDRVPIGSKLERSMLALLALRPGQPSTREEIAASLWGASPPRSWINVIHTYASRLRRALSPDAISFGTDGYRLMTAPGRVDAVRFRALLADLDGADPTAALALVEEGLGLWRGRLGGGLTPFVRHHPAAVELESLRTTAALRYAELAAGTDRVCNAVTVLASIAGEHPDEPAVRIALAQLLTVPSNPAPPVRTPTVAPSTASPAEDPGPPPADDAALTLAVLGTVTLTRAGHVVNVGGPLARTALAALALRAGRTVSVPHLTELLWGERPPTTAAAQLHTQISRLRAALRRAGVPDILRTEPGGYSVRADAITTDLAAARELIVGGRSAVAAGRHAEAADGFRRALLLWQGPELSGVTEHLSRAEVPRLAELRQGVAEEQIAAEIEAGSPQSVLPELDALITRHPLREELHRLRMLALYRLGRRGEALATFAAARAVLRGELGLDPSPALAELEAEILASGGDPPDTAGRAPVPAQLPPTVYGFAGRGAELDGLRAMFAERTPAAGSRIMVLAGMPGIGKTALAVHAATQAIGDFPDGQLFADLGGAGPGARPAATVLADLLGSLGVNDASIPRDAAGRAALLRTLTWDRRILVILDDAASEEQVEQLLPAGPGCAVLITSRRALPGLDVTRRLTVAPLDDGAAEQTLAGWAGAELIAADPAATRELVRACAGVPLALRIIGARLAAFPHFTPADVAIRLRDDRRLLGELVAGGRSVRASLSACVRLLSRRARSALVRLSRYGGIQYTRTEIAVTLGMSVSTVDAVIEELADLHLIAMAGPRTRHSVRYRLNDLVRLFATECDPDVVALPG